MEWNTNIVAKENGNSDWEKPRSGLIDAICFRVWDVGNHPSEYQAVSKIVNKIVLGFEVSARYTRDTESKGKQMVVCKIFTNSLHEKANLSISLESWFSKKITYKVRRDGFSINNLVGKRCSLSINEDGKIATINPKDSRSDIEVQGTIGTEIPKLVQAMRAKAIIEPPNQPEPTCEDNFNDITPKAPLQEISIPQDDLLEAVPF